MKKNILQEMFLKELMNQIDENSTDGELLRQALIAESDAVSLYVQLARKAKTNIVKNLLLDLSAVKLLDL